LIGGRISLVWFLAVFGGVLLLLAAGAAVRGWPFSHTGVALFFTSRRHHWSLFLWAVLVFAPKGIRHPPAGDAGHSSLPRQRRLTRRKPTLPGAEQSRALGVLVSSYGHSSAGLCRYRFEGPRRCQLPGCVVRPPVAESLPIRPSAGTGADRHDTSHRDGFVVGRARWSRSRAYQPGATAPTTEPVRLQLRGRPLRERQTA